MARLEFLFSEVDIEIGDIAAITDKFIDANSAFVFYDLRRTLAQIRQSPSGHSYGWGIAEELPLRTTISCGDYEPGNRMGEHNVFAEITSNWEIEPLGPHNPGSQPHRRFALAGVASTRVRIFRTLPGGQEELAMWRMEIGDENSPGCHFHVQILGESDDPPFPHSLSIPRLPGLLVTPMSVVEFVLGELFQDMWRMHVSRETSDMKQWQSIQRKRLSNLLDWQSEQVRNSPGFPWTELKWAKPPVDLFL